MKLRIKTIGMLVWVFILAGTVYAEPKPSDKLIGTWIAGTGTNSGYDNDLGNYYEITKDKIIFIRANYSQHRTWTWTDNNDGKTITIRDKSGDDMFCPYAVTDKYLYLTENCLNNNGSILFIKSESRSLVKLLGEWVLPQPDINVSVTITYDKIIYKKGKLTEEKELKLGVETKEKFEDYLFLDDTHVIVSMDIMPENIPIEFEYDWATGLGLTGVMLIKK